MTALRLRVEPPEGEPVEQLLTVERVVVGRLATADLVLDDVLVSRQHARLSCRPDGWWIEDVGARNRTFLNDRELEGPAPLQPGDVLRMGRTRIHVLDPPAPTAGSATQHADPPATPGRPDETEAPGSRQAARLSLLNDVHRALAAPIALPDLLALILERCFAVLCPEQGVILLRDARGELTRAATRQLPGQSGDIVISRRIVEEVAGKCRATLVLDATRDERLAGSESVASSGVRSVVAVPLVDSDGTLGLIALSSRARVRQFNEQDLEVLESLASAAALRVRNVGLAEEAAARRVLEHELALAHAIQMAMLPRVMPTHAGLEVAAVLKPARSVGGDLYDVVLHNGRLWLIVADVSGKGVAAALYMAVAKTLFRALVPDAASTAQLAGRINQELRRDNDRDMFVTALLGCLEPAHGVVSLCDAGHIPPLIVRRTGETSRPVLCKRVALGVAPDVDYVDVPVRLDAGDMLVCHTDGITEARAADGATFDRSGLERALQTRLGQPMEAVVHGVVDDVARFTAGAPQEDDQAVLGLRYR